MNSNPALYLTLTIVLIVAGWSCMRAASRAASWWTVACVVGVVARLIALVWVLPSDDVNRYLWEGKIVASGRSPYAAPADDPMWAADRDVWWQAMNHRGETTVYPPLMQLAGAAITTLSSGPFGFKVFALLGDLLVLFLLLRHVADDPALRGRVAAFWIINPVPVISFAGEAHFDSVMIAAALAAVLAARRGNHALGWMWLGAAVAIKWTALILLPLWLLRTRGRGGWAALPVLILPALPFWDTLDELAHALLHFGSAFGSNNPLHYALTWLTGSRPTASLGCVLLLAVAGLFILRRTETWLHPAARLWAALILMLPTVTYWYAAWVLPFAALAGRSRAWWIFSATVVFYYAAAWKSQTTGVWGHPPWAVALTWLPLYGALLLAAQRGRRTA